MPSRSECSSASPSTTRSRVCCPSAFWGGYTTFSTASLDSVRLLAARRYLAALWNGPGMLILATALAVLGIVLARS
nr:CrcB family protein [Leucobacter muris]